MATKFFGLGTKRRSHKKNDDEDEGTEMVSIHDRVGGSGLKKGMRLRIVVMDKDGNEVPRSHGGAPEDIIKPVGMTMTQSDETPQKHGGEVMVDVNNEKTTYLVVENDESEDHVWMNKMQVSTFACVVCVGIGLLGLILAGVVVGVMVSNSTSNEKLGEKGFAIVVNILNKLMQNETIACEVSYIANKLCAVVSDEFIPILGMPLSCNFTPATFGFPEDFVCVPLPYFYGTVDGSELASILSSHSGFYEQLSALRKLNKGSSDDSPST